MLNTAVNRVAGGRRLATRRIVMNTLATVPSQIWRKHVEYSNAQDEATPNSALSFEALAVSAQDEPNYRYEHLGYAYVLIDHFNGGYVHKNQSFINPSDLSITAQIEPYDENLVTQLEQISNIPDVVLKEGDLLGLMIYQDFMLWFEIVGQTGQTMMADFGMKYILNRRDDLQFEPITSEK
ncbi:hypothetical protein [Acinetobacter boissieri]|uniref:Uncharacterized protein n=1 Tax=Acinetobacter boissieri TaxID=1219383 RepID=A0A1G6KEL6_9GAMM|nr:hypothetical protein [Acinetobacter boissieri]SDC29015.1 hypothetical protein SAMN05421733_11625 [Acinetobacter boissieri]